MAVLFTVETPQARLVVSGPAVAVRDVRETVRVRPAPGVRDVRLEVGGVGVEDGEAPLRIDEETTVSVWLESLDGARVDLRHADPVVTAALGSARSGTIVHGPVRFGSVAGRSVFVVAVGGVPEATVEVTVSPAKASWADVEAMRARVESVAAGASMASLRPVTAGAEAVDGPVSAPAWLALVRAQTPHLVRALTDVARNPETVTARRLVSVRPHTLHRASAETLRALRGASAWPARVPGRPARPGLDTPAHRWLARGLGDVLARTARLRDAEAVRPPSARRAAIVTELDRHLEALGPLRRLEPLAAAHGPAPAAPPLALRSRPAYAAAAGALRALRGTLRLAEGDAGVPAQDLSALYETWAALETVDAFARAVGAVGAEAPERPFGARTVGTEVQVGRGRRHAVRLVGERAEVEIVRQPRFAGPPALLVQIPDLLVTLRAPGRPERRVVLDAKYRLAPGGDAPPGDALGALHRYRDAIVGPDGRALVDAAAVLFPVRAGADEKAAAFEASRLWTSLGTIGVGAVPLLPGGTGWLEALARRLVSGDLVRGSGGAPGGG